MTDNSFFIKTSELEIPTFIDHASAPTPESGNIVIYTKNSEVNTTRLCTKDSNDRSVEYGPGISSGVITVRLSQDETLTQDANVIIPWKMITENRGGYFSGIDSSNRIEIKQDGWYMAQLSLEAEHTANTDEFFIALTTDGTTLSARPLAAKHGSVPTVLTSKTLSTTMLHAFEVTSAPINVSTVFFHGLSSGSGSADILKNGTKMSIYRLMIP